MENLLFTGIMMLLIGLAIFQNMQDLFLLNCIGVLGILNCINENNAIVFFINYVGIVIVGIILVLTAIKFYDDRYKNFRALKNHWCIYSVCGDEHCIFVDRVKSGFFKQEILGEDDWGSRYQLKGKNLFLRIKKIN